MFLVQMGVVALLGVPLLLAVIALFVTRHRIRTPGQVVWLTLALILLLAWQLMPILYLAALDAGTSGEDALYIVVLSALMGMTLIGWNAGRLVCRVSIEAMLSPPFDAARSAALVAALYALAFAVLAWTRDTRWTDWMREWPPIWVSVPLTLILAVGLWRRSSIAAWVALAFALFTLLWVFHEPAFAKRFIRMDPVFLKEPLGPLLSWLLALVLPGARRGCQAQRPS
jgi:hypothetical protein